MSNRIDLSSGWVLGTGNMVSRLMYSNSWSTLAVKANSGVLSAAIGLGYPDIATYTAQATGSVITIMKGIMPTSIGSLTPTLVWAEIKSRFSDELVIFDTAQGHFNPSSYTVNPAIISTSFNVAKATGTATWFWLRSYGGQPNGSNPGTIGQQAIGTVGLIGSGADLEMADVNLLTGDSYRISGMKIEFPTSWTF